MPESHRGGTHPTKPTPGSLGAPSAETRRTAAAKRSLSPNLYLPGIGKTIRCHDKRPNEPASMTFPLTKESTKVNITCLFTYVYVVYRKLSFACDMKEFDTNSGHKSA